MKIALELPAPASTSASLAREAHLAVRAQPAQNPRSTRRCSARRAFTVPPPADPRKDPDHRRPEGPRPRLHVDRTTEGGLEYNRLTATFLATPRAVGKLEIPRPPCSRRSPSGRRTSSATRPRACSARATPRARSRCARSPRPAAPPRSRAPSAISSRSRCGQPLRRQARRARRARHPAQEQPAARHALARPAGRRGAPAQGQVHRARRVAYRRAVRRTAPPRRSRCAQVTGPATEVPALAFSYFDPTKNAYQTIRSEPDRAVRSAAAVRRRRRCDRRRAARRAAPRVRGDRERSTPSWRCRARAPSTIGPLSGALALGSALLYADPARRARAVAASAPRTAREAAEVRAAAAASRSCSIAAGPRPPARSPARSARPCASSPARPGGPPAPRPAPMMGSSCSPGSRPRASRPAPRAAAVADLRSDAAGLLRRWSGARRPGSAAGRAAATLALATLGAALALPADARADALGEGRGHYEQAMTIADPTARKAAFARAAVALGEAARQDPDRPELLADWGNAALGAGDRHRHPRLPARARPRRRQRARPPQPRLAALAPGRPVPPAVGHRRHRGAAVLPRLAPRPAPARRRRRVRRRRAPPRAVVRPPPPRARRRRRAARRDLASRCSRRSRSRIATSATPSSWTPSPCAPPTAPARPPR